jgi:hypothetical protein
MKFLCLDYGGEEDWPRLTQQEQEELLAQDEVLRDEVLRSGGAFMSAVETTVMTVNEAAQLVAGTPCARAIDAIEIRPLMQSGSD